MPHAVVRVATAPPRQHPADGVRRRRPPTNAPLPRQGRHSFCGPAGRTMPPHAHGGGDEEEEEISA